MKRLVAGFLAVLMVLVGCVAAGAEGMTPGTYTAEAEGFHGTIKLEVTVDAEAITGIEVVEHSETAGIGEAALPVLVESVLEHQTTGVDSVAGATVTSEAFKAALTDALTQAGADMDKMSQPVEADELEAVTMEADVVVVGAGAAGLSAGLKAAQDGKNVIILEKMGVIGGARCQYHLRQILVFLDAMVMNKPEFMGGVIQNKVDPQTGEVIDQGTLDHLTGQLTAFGEFIQRVKI